MDSERAGSLKALIATPKVRETYDPLRVCGIHPPTLREDPRRAGSNKSSIWDALRGPDTAVCQKRWNISGETDTGFMADHMIMQLSCIEIRFVMCNNVCNLFPQSNTEGRISMKLGSLLIAGSI